MKTNFHHLYLAIILFSISIEAFSQTQPIIGEAQINLGADITASFGERVNIPVIVDLSAVTATDVNGGAVPAALGNYRVAVTYDNTLMKAVLDNGYITGGDAAEFSSTVSAKLTSNGDTDLLIFSATQLSGNTPVGLINIAQLVFDITSFEASTATLSTTVLDLRTPISVTGFPNQVIMGGVTIPYQSTGAQVDIQASSDIDNDGLPDAWESSYTGFTIGVDDGYLDFDGDGLTNLDEFLMNTHPVNPDSDGDLVPDGYESSNGTDPLDENIFPLWVISEPILNADLETEYLYQVVVNKPGATFTLISSPIAMVIDNNGLITWQMQQDQSGIFNVSLEVNVDMETAIQDFVIMVPGSGDVNGDGYLNVADYLLLQQHVLGIRTLTAEQQSRADIYLGNGDGEINIQDMILLSRKILGI